MPRLTSNVPETYVNIVRPVALQVARQLAKMLNLPADIQVLLPGNAETTLYPNTELGAQGTADPTLFGSNELLTLEVLENPVEDRILTTAVQQLENIPFFLDEGLNIRAYPVYSGTELTFTFTYRANSRTNARRFRNEILTKTSELREEILHELDYYYHVPYVFLHLLKHLHTLRETVAGYGEDWDTYVTKHITSKATTIADQIGQNRALAIREFQTNPLGFFQLVGTTEPEEKDKDTGTFNIQFQYRFVFDQVVKAVIEYPLMVHNQLIADQWHSKRYPLGELTDPDRRKRAPSLSRHVFDKFTTVYTDWCVEKLTDGYLIPEFDEWRPEWVIPNTSTLFVALLALDPTAPNTLFELMGDLDGYALDPALKDFIVGEAPYMTTKGASIFDLRLYEGPYPMNDDLLTVTTPDLIVLSNAAMDLRRIYHIRLSLVNDLFTLGPAAWERLRNGGEAALRIINCLQYKMLGKAFSPKLLGGQLIPNADLRFIAQRINDLKVPHKGPLEHVMLTVNDVVIVTHRSSDNGTSQDRVFGPPADGSDPGEDSFTKPTERCS